MKDQLPMRKDNMPDLDSWEEYIEQNGYTTIGELVDAEQKATSDHEKILLSKALTAKKNEIAQGFAKILHEEDLSTQEAISVIELAKQVILSSKFIPEGSDNGICTNLECCSNSKQIAPIVVLGENSEEELKQQIKKQTFEQMEIQAGIPPKAHIQG